MKTLSPLINNTLLFFFFLGNPTRSISQTAHCAEFKQAAETKSKFDPRARAKLRSGWHFQVSAEPAMIIPDETFYENFNSALGGSVGCKAYHVNDEGKPQGLSVGLSYQTVKLNYGLSSAYGFGYNVAPPTGSVRVSVLALEGGRVFPIGENGSNFYLTIGLAAVNNKGQAPTTDDLLGYQEGTRGAIKLDAGFAVQLSPNIGLDFGSGFTVMQAKITYPELSNYSQTQSYGTLYKLGAGLFFLL